MSMYAYLNKKTFKVQVVKYYNASKKNPATLSGDIWRPHD